MIQYNLGEENSLQSDFNSVDIEDVILRFPDEPETFIDIFLEKKLSVKQELFITATKTKKHVVAIWSRQTGKSTVIAAYIVWRLLFGKGCIVNGEHMNENIIVTAPIKDQIENLFIKIDQLITKSKYIEGFITKKNTNKIIAKNGNRITFLSASPGSHIRGPTATCIVIDETQDILDSKYYGDIMPFGSTTNPLIIEAGTPKTKNHFYDTINAKSVFVVKQLYFECPFLSESFIADQKANMPEALFRQEYMCEFLEEGVLAFPGRLFEMNKDPNSAYHGSWNLKNYKYIEKIEEFNEEYRVQIHDLLQEGATFTAGQDLGRQNDHTVLTILRTDVRPIQVMACIIFPLGQDYIEVGKRTAFVYNIYKPIEFNVDYSSEKSYVDILINLGVPVQLQERSKTKKRKAQAKTGAIAFTNKIKSEMVNNARVLLEKYELQLPSRAETLLSQFMNQHFEYSEEQKKYKFYHPSNENDDALWACLLALKNVRVLGRNDKVQFVNPWERYDEVVHSKYDKEVYAVKKNYKRREEGYMNSDLRRSHGSIRLTSRMAAT